MAIPSLFLTSNVSANFSRGNLPDAGQSLKRYATSTPQERVEVCDRFLLQLMNRLDRLENKFPRAIDRDLRKSATSFFIKDCQTASLPASTLQRAALNAARVAHKEYGIGIYANQNSAMMLEDGSQYSTEDFYYHSIL